MSKIVIKFGGTSVGSIEKIIAAAKIVHNKHKEGNEIIVVVSAMAGQTNDLISNAKKIAKNFKKRELDLLLSSGEQVTAALMAGALNELGVNSRSWLNWQIPILTEGEHSNSRIINMNIIFKHEKQASRSRGVQTSKMASPPCVALTLLSASRPRKR